MFYSFINQQEQLITLFFKTKFLEMLRWSQGIIPGVAGQAEMLFRYAGSLDHAFQG
jgi:hypothetical protein